ncbi:hypothetical protein ASF23_03900 [Curtobacterium sp. Leaf261]|nr:hypothetical protein ASF23_03900 [Curtobacterium sp. Leaf261]
MNDTARTFAERPLGGVRMRCYSLSPRQAESCAIVAHGVRGVGVRAVGEDAGVGVYPGVLLKANCSRFSWSTSPAAQGVCAPIVEAYLFELNSM